MNWSEAEYEWQARVLNAKMWRPDEGWPDVSDRQLLTSTETWLAPYLEKVSNENDDTLGFICTDNDGVKCAILIVTRKKENNRMQFYINYPDLKMVYNIYTTK